MDLIRVFSDAQAVPSFLGDLVSKPPACYCSSSQSSLGHRPRNQDQCIFLFSSNQSEAFRPLGVSNQFSSTPVCCKFPVSLTLPSTTKFLPDARARQFSVCSPRPWSQSWSCQASTLHSVFHGGPKWDNKRSFIHCWCMIPNQDPILMRQLSGLASLTWTCHWKPQLVSILWRSLQHFHMVGASFGTGSWMRFRLSSEAELLHKSWVLLRTGGASNFTVAVSQAAYPGLGARRRQGHWIGYRNTRLFPSQWVCAQYREQEVGSTSQMSVSSSG